MAAKLGTPFDVYGCLLQLLLFYYDISKTVVFWTNVFLILPNGGFSLLCLAANKHTETVIRRIFYAFRVKPLDTKHFQDDTMLVRQQRYHEKNVDEKRAFLKRESAENEAQNKLLDWQSIEDWLADSLDFVMNTKSRLPRRPVGDLEEEEEETASKLFVKSATTKDTNLFRNLIKPIDYCVDEPMDTSAEELICPICSHRMQTRSFRRDRFSDGLFTALVTPQSFRS